ncbi:double-stranded RNA-binding protein Staufen homolog 2 isoform X1 [Frankliniella occidentalis]|uniref:Double-stranded RNA-binding protein Staufen homolog 2 isoform X1 n=2 Tax=Frankliniella occidentalis TaxID=133901 RepID=A0A6J1S4C6_FRAOC|nr:double-stranded RNA-binding protein Staufen homolog 2 isoform X1 [Frankliniella occidentalis]XP_026275862.1 double-stranded RNA-binding protein Staufen homolog 2 isoform X1 [Frankliniella occidentalis]XP_052127689.1 double-stranded RNA-binding protein Staufen homolog 2 isoform X1 [Frankliniella occidentalis]XP_052127690.1 double-stranded RNA-binding protein Staufen homolog 2 isoform X1 [Frankliniella occidentalis]
MTLRTNIGLTHRPGTLATMPSPVMVQSAPAQPSGYDTGLSVMEPKANEIIEQNENGGAEATNINNLLANNKEKTPMCLVNELARYNKIPHQYRLTNEQGPAHRKQFTVTLKLGEEEYTAEGASIKKAQHQAASIALSKTNYKHPPSKPRSNIRVGKNNITPTVELNAWAMKRGELATYHMIPNALPPIPHVGPPCPAMAPGLGPMTNYMPPVGPPPHMPYPGYSNFRPPYNHHQVEFQIRPPNPCGEMAAWGPPRPTINMYARPHLSKYEQQRYYAKPSIYPGGHPTFTVMVKVGTREFLGEGATAQLARHAAAAKALDEIRQLPLPDEKISPVSENGTLPVKEETGSEIKSPISLVHEVALRRNLTVKFEVVRVTGPPHMRSFHTVCTVGEFTTEGIGNGKKLSKKRASEKMLEELKKLPPESPCVVAAVVPANAKVKRKPTQKKKSRNLIKEPKPASPVESPTHSVVPEKEEMNPISRLIQIQQAKKDQEPLYKLEEEKGAPRRREFVMSVKVGDIVCKGTGPNKKLAKRAAAEAMLLELGYSRPPSGSSGGACLKNSNGKETRKVPDTPSVGGTSGRQLVPGLLLVPDSNYVPPVKGTVISPATSSMAKELLQTGKTGADPQSSENTTVVSPKDQLLYLAQLLDFKVQFSDFPKGNHSEYLSLVTLSTAPPHVCHGAGHTVEASHDQAALTALKMLAEMGLDMFSNKKETSPSPTPSNTVEG